MKNAKQRVIAIDYFRGICLMLVLVNHSIFFSMPFALWTGAGGLWTSAAEMFLLLSGITYGIVRGGLIKTQFKSVLRKTWRRAAIIYSINIALVFMTLLMGLFFSVHGLTSDINGTISNSPPIALATSILTFHYSIGWADFLMYFSVFLLFAPFMLFTLKTRYWVILPILSFAIFTAHYFHAPPGGLYGTFLAWQIYFVMGLVIGRFREELITSVYSLPDRFRKAAGYVVTLLAATIMTLSYLLEHSIYPTVSRLANDGWLPVKLQAAYIHLLNLRTGLDRTLLDDRNGIARPFLSLLVAAAIYIIYMRYGRKMLDLSGKFFLALGRDSLWVFAAQAILIPILAALPLQRSLVNNTLLTATLLLSMWAITQRRLIANNIKSYLSIIRDSYYEAKYAYWSGSENDS